MPPSNTLDTIADIVTKDPGLKANISAADIADGAAAARLMNDVIYTALRATGANDDGVVTPRELYKISQHIRSNPDLYADFVEGHGNDEGRVETGFHLVQGDGGTLKFQGRGFVNTTADAIYHMGFSIRDGRFRNEDGDANETVADVAGWLNYFLNGESRIFGSYRSETLHSGDYSDIFADAQNEIFDAGSGHDTIWAGAGDDTVFAGAGDDISGGGIGNDTLYGEGGNDKLLGDDGNDRLFGGDGGDTLKGGAGRDQLSGGTGRDVFEGGAGADLMLGWEKWESRDIFVISSGDTGTSRSTMDVISGFKRGTDKIDLTGFDGLAFSDADSFSGNGSGELYFDGDYVRIDEDGDGRLDAMFELRFVNAVSESDFIL